MRRRRDAVLITDRRGKVEKKRASRRDRCHENTQSVALENEMVLKDV